MGSGDALRQTLLGSRSVVWVRSQIEDGFAQKASAALR